jgi:WD40 repeat protein
VVSRRSHNPQKCEGGRALPSAPLPDAPTEYTSFVSRRGRLILILLILIGAGIAVATAVRRPVAFVPAAFVLEQTLLMDREDRPVKAAFIPGKDSILYGAQWKPFTIFDLSTGRRRDLTSDPSFGDFALSPDGASAVIAIPGPGPASMELGICDLASGKVSRTFPFRRGGSDTAWSPDGRRIVYAVTWMLFVLDSERGEIQTVPLTDNHSDRVDSLAFSPDGRLLGIGTWDGEASLWRTDSWTLVQKFDLGSDPNPKLGRNGMSKIAFSPDSTLFAAGGGSFYGTLDLPNTTLSSGALRVWRTSDYKPALSINPGKPVVSLSFSPNRTLAYATWSQVHIVDLGTGKEICHLEARRPSVAFGQDGRLMTLHEREGIRIWKRAP